LETALRASRHRVQLTLIVLSYKPCYSPHGLVVDSDVFLNLHALHSRKRLFRMVCVHSFTGICRRNPVVIRSPRSASAYLMALVHKDLWAGRSEPFPTQSTHLLRQYHPST
jgi:hypothetical protein